MTITLTSETCSVRARAKSSQQVIDIFDYFKDLARGVIKGEVEIGGERFGQEMVLDGIADRVLHMGMNLANQFYWIPPHGRMDDEKKRRLKLTGSL